jgi:hypothetical protein
MRGLLILNRVAAAGRMVTASHCYYCYDIIWRLYSTLEMQFISLLLLILLKVRQHTWRHSQQGELEHDDPP